MGLFNRNKNEDTIDNEMLVIMGEIRDNLKINNDDILTKLESKITDAKYSNDEEIGVISTKIGKLEKLVELQDQTINRLQQRQDKYDELIDLIMDLVQSHSKVLEEQEQLKETEVTYETNEINDNETKSYKDLFIEKYEGWASRPYTLTGLKYDGFEFRTNGGTSSNTYVCNILQLKELNDKLDEVIKEICKNNDFKGICEKIGIPFHVNNLFIKRILFTLINKEPVFMNPLSELNNQHTYQFKKGILYIDNEYTKLTVDDINYIKSCLENTANKKETIENFIDLFQMVDNEYIRIISCNIEKIPSEFLEQQSRVRVENDPKGRF